MIGACRTGDFDSQKIYLFYLCNWPALKGINGHL